MKPSPSPRNFRSLLLGLGVVSGAFVLSSCSEKAGTGESVNIPTFTVNCTTSHCRTNASAVVYVRITNYNCDPVNDGVALASSSFNINCNGTSGCFGNTTSWTNERGALTTIAASSYTICARIDYQPINYPAITNDDTTATIFSQSISKDSGPVSINTWTDP